MNAVFFGIHRQGFKRMCCLFFFCFFFFFFFFTRLACICAYLLPPVCQIRLSEMCLFCTHHGLNHARRCSSVILQCDTIEAFEAPTFLKSWMWQPYNEQWETGLHGISTEFPRGPSITDLKPALSWHSAVIHWELRRRFYVCRDVPPDSCSLRRGAGPELFFFFFFEFPPPLTTSCLLFAHSPMWLFLWCKI